MYPGKYAVQHPDKPAFIMAESGEVVTYREYEARCNRLAHLLRERGLKQKDHYAFLMENNARYLESCGAGERAGLYFTCVNSYLTAEELAYILDNSESQILITSEACREVALAAMGQCPNLRLCIVVDGLGAGEEVKAVVQPMPGHAPDDALAAELMAYCQLHLARQKCPRSVDFEQELPRLPTGKLYKRILRNGYWGDRKIRIV